MTKLFAFLAILAFLLAYVFSVASVRVATAIQPVNLLYAGLVFTVLYVAGAGKYLNDRVNRDHA